jgi:hypothetical protein
MSDPKKDAKSKPNGKGRPTPTRREREAANIRPLVGKQSKEAIAEAKAKQIEARKKARAAMLSGDERYLLARDRGPQRKIAREILDFRYTFIEGLLPMMMVFLVFSAIDNRSTQEIITVVMLIALGISAVEVTILNAMLKKRIREKLGAGEKIQRGNWFYMFTRGMQPRPLRIPKPAPRRQKNKK